MGTCRALHAGHAHRRVHAGHHGPRRYGLRAAPAPVPAVPAPRGLYRPAHRPAARATGAATPGAPAATARVHGDGARGVGQRTARAATGERGLGRTLVPAGVQRLRPPPQPSFATLSECSRAHPGRSLSSSMPSPTSISRSRRYWLDCNGATLLVEEGGGLWYNLRQPARIGLPAPISTLLAASGG